MSDAVYPILPGLAFSVVRTLQWSTNSPASKTGKKYPIGDRMYPTYKYKLPYEFLRAYGSYSEWATLFGFINQRRGKLDDFLYRDPDDYLATAQGLGVGDGVTKTFPLVRSLGGFVEPIIASDAAFPSINGVAQSYPSQYTVDQAAPNASAIIFAAAPAAGAVLTWSGTYYWRCNFTMDGVPFDKFDSGLWKVDIEFETHPL